jgi:hypothetical protein
MAKQYLHGAQISGPLVNHGRLRSAQGVSSVLAHVQTDGCDPIINKPGILAGAQMAEIVDPAREDEVVMCAAAALEPG